MGRLIETIGVERVERLVKQVETRDLPGSIPGFSMLGCY